MRIKSKMKLIVTFVLVMSMIIMTFSPVYAWKPKTHVYTANLILEELQAGNGYLTFPYFGQIKVPDEYYAAITAYPDYFRAGSVGPDGFPDIYVGQAFAHPKTNLSAGEWIKYLMDQLKKLPAGSEERKQVLAFTLGYTVHASGDLFGHSYVNEWAGDPWPDIADADGLSTDDFKIIVKHNVVEEYIAKQTPSMFTTVDKNTIAAPKQFIYNNFVTNGKSPNYDNVGSDAVDINSFYSRTGALPKHFQMFFDIRKELKNGIATRAAYNPVRIYQEYWLEDIDEGLRTWVDTSEKVAQDLLLPENGLTKAKEDLSDWAVNHFLSMVGFPDVAGGVISLISDLTEMIEGIIPDNLNNLITEMKNNFYDVIFMWAFDVKYTQLDAMVKDPVTFLNNPSLFPAGSEARLRGDLNNLSYGTTLDRITFRPVENTVTMAKLNLIGQQGMEELLRLANMEYLGTTSYPPICFIKSLDVGYDWNDVDFTGLSIWDDLYAREAIFNHLFVSESSKYQWYTKNECQILDAYNSIMSQDPDPGNMMMYSQLMEAGWTIADVQNDLRQRMIVQAQLDDYRRKTEITEETLTQDTVINSLYPGYGRAVYKSLSLNGKKLTVNGNLEIDRMGMINVNHGTLIVNGNLIIKDQGVIIKNIKQGGMLSIDGGNVIVKGNLMLNGGIVDVGKGSLNISGDLDQPGGLLDVNEGSVYVNGNYANSMVRRPSPGATGSYATLYHYSSGLGVLSMDNDADRVVVGGSFITTTKVPHDKYLTAGTLEVKGDFYQSTWSNGLNISNGVADLFLKDAAKTSEELKAGFKATGRHRVLLSGSKVQNVGFATTGVNYSQFSILEITNPTEVKFITKVTVGGLFKHNGKRFTLSDATGSIFPDYDGDGQKDNVDSTPCPAGQDPINDPMVIVTGTIGRTTAGTGIISKGATGKGTIGTSRFTDNLYNPRLPQKYWDIKLPSLPGVPADTGSDPSARLVDPKLPGRLGGAIKLPPTSPGTTTTTNSAAPAIEYKAPGNLKATPGENSVTLQWDDIASQDVIGYKLYRQEGSEKFTPVVDLIIEDYSYVDEGVIAGNTYTYVCKAVYAGEKESEGSNMAAATPFSVETPGLSAYLEDNKVILELPDLTKAEAAGYNIYKGTMPDEQAPNPINRTPITNYEFTDSNVKAGTTYYYVCTIEYKDGSESETSAEISINVPASETSMAAEEVKVTLQLAKPTLNINGDEMAIEVGSTIKPIDVKGTFMAPIRVFEAFGSNITQNVKLKSVTIELEKNKITLIQGSTKATVNGVSKVMKAVPQMVNGRLLVPVQFIAENLGCKYFYDSQSRTVTLIR